MMGETAKEQHTVTTEITVEVEKNCKEYEIVWTKWAEEG